MTCISDVFSTVFNKLVIWKSFLWFMNLVPNVWLIYFFNLICIGYYFTTINFYMHFFDDQFLHVFLWRSICTCISLTINLYMYFCKDHKPLLLRSTFISMKICVYFLEQCVFLRAMCISEKNNLSNLYFIEDVLLFL